MTSGYDLTDLANISARTIGYNADNMPVQVTHARYGTTNISYDGTSNRVKKISPSGVITYYVGEHFEVKNNEPIKYIFAGNLRVAKVAPTGTYFFHKDHLGSSAAMTTDTGAVVETSNYMPFGEMREHSGIEVTNYKFTDQEFDPETGLYYYGARYYDPTIGRFISPDSIVPSPYDPQTLNRYTYCRNNPIIYTDPSGNFAFLPILIGAAIGALTAGIQSDWNAGAMLAGAVIGGISGGVFSGVEGAVAGSLTSAVQSGTISATTAGVISGAAGGAAAGAVAGGLGAAIYGGNIGQGMLMGAGLGAIGGAVFGGIDGYFGKSWNMYRVGAYGLAGGGLSELSGQGFAKGAIFAGAVAFARFAYNEFVGFDAAWESGGEAQDKDRLTMPCALTNNCGTQGRPVDINSLFGEGGIVSRGINAVTGGNSICGLHDALVVKIDNIFGGQGFGAFMRNTLNVPLMPAAAALSYGALMADPRTMIFYSVDPTKDR